MPDPQEDVAYELALASRMLANEGVLDAFGHVSLRHPGDRYCYDIFTQAARAVGPGRPGRSTTCPSASRTHQRSASGKWPALPTPAARPAPN